MPKAKPLPPRRVIAAQQWPPPPRGAIAVRFVSNVHCLLAAPSTAQCVHRSGRRSVDHTRPCVSLRHFVGKNMALSRTSPLAAISEDCKSAELTKYCVPVQCDFVLQTKNGIARSRRCFPDFTSRTARHIVTTALFQLRFENALFCHISPRAHVALKLM